MYTYLKSDIGLDTILLEAKINFYKFTLDNEQANNVNISSTSNERCQMKKMIP